MFINKIFKFFLKVLWYIFNLFLFYISDKKFDELQIPQYKSFIHFGLTSQDINNTAILYSFQAAIINVYMPLLDNVTNRQVLHVWAKR